MKPLLLAVSVVLLFSACNKTINKEDVKKEIKAVEKAFEKMTVDKGITYAFYYYADTNAVIKRQNDTLIKGKQNIKAHFEKQKFDSTTVTWDADFVDVSDCGNLAYTYGHYVWTEKNGQGEATEYKGVFHTVWKRQADNSWKYVWD